MMFYPFDCYGSEAVCRQRRLQGNVGRSTSMHESAAIMCCPLLCSENQN